MAISDSVQSEMGQQANMRMPIADPAQQPIYYIDPNDLENVEDPEGQPNIRIRRPSRSQ